ncbi:cytoplasmic dynein 2 heavy chain 1 isoform X1 [Mus musculus]|uniref:Isoform 2 of Cytoplasmic dynein 2 heavy chain 1 n=1 Tax=Mus musculus TaxID=10090 RepID=Q45VK7-2|nr:cytoplasmic dynein 2 heavy chain 1 isoform X1 [Mus musculus]|eukprot:XP_006509889.1 PREDICTED: cytoplasmic dynein 2 heavy chain 1 isoform X1 [Mus musculus]
MAGSLGDVRKLFLFTTTQNYFGLRPELWDQPPLSNCPEVNNFLDDGNQMLLRVQRSEAGLAFSNTIDFDDAKDKVLVFFKLRPEVITDGNLHNNILVSSMLESPINSLYQAVRQVFAPMLLKDQEWSRNFDPKLQNLLSELEAGLGIVLRKSDTNLPKLKLKEDDTRGILTPSDEFQFWIEQAHRGSKQISKERASYFKELFETISREFYNLDSLSLLEVVDLVETTRDVVDDVWRQTEHDHYPESRMLHLLDVIGGSFGRFVQKKLGSLKLWEDPYYLVKENLKAGISICEQWVIVCSHLTGQVWQRYVPHPWKSGKYFPETLDKLGKRLEEVLAIRTIHEKLLYFLPASEERIVCLSRVFEPFTGVNPVQYNPYTEPLWKAAVSQYEKIIAPAEQKIAGKLKNYISEIQDSPQQLLQAFLKYKELVKRPTISKELMLERETLLARLGDSAKDFRLDFENRCRGIPGDPSGPLSGKNLSEVVNNIVWVRQLELKVDDTIKIAEALLSDLSGFRSFHRSAEDLLDQFKLYEQEQFDDWSREVQSGLSDSRSGLCIEANSRIMELDPNDGALKVHYSDRLVILLREVRQLSALGFVIPAKIQQVANVAQKFCKQAIILKQVAHFYNSIDQQMIQSQRPMMLQSALAFEQIIKNSKAGSGGKSQITWDNPKELEGYIQKLQNAAERLATENRRLRKWHTTFCEKVVILMNIDLLRQQQRWKDGLQELRTGLATVAAQGFQASDMRAWRQHWNHQLYKALEHQYQVGLEALNENLPEINVDLTYKQGRLQFRPPFEEIRAKYYREMKRFIGIPNQFKGVGEAGDESIFSVMIDRNASGFLTIYSKAEDLFRRLSAVLHQHKEWVVIGQVDMEALVEKNLSTVHDWEKNFKALKIKGKEVERLPSAVKVDCLNINCSPVKTVIDDLIQKLFDLLVLSLKKSIQTHIHEIDTFVTEAMKVLTVIPQSVEEIGDTNVQYSNLQDRRPEILPLFQEAEDKNRLLRTVAGGGVETVSNLRAKWDKFELMMESHQLMIKDQIEVMKGNVKSRLQIYYQELDKFKARWDQLKPGDDIIETGQQNTMDQSAKSIKEKKIEFDDLEVIRKKLVDDCHHFGLEEPNFSLAYSISKDIESCAQIWALYEEFQQGLQDMAKEDWITYRAKIYLFEEFLINWHERLRKIEEHSVMTVKLQSEVDRYKMIIPILKYVRGEHLSPDHWLDLFRLLGLPRGTSLEKLLFGDLLRVADTIVEKASELKDLNSRAQGEVTIREALRELDLWGVGAVFSLIDYEDSQNHTIKLIKDWKDIVNQVGDNRCLLQSLKDSPYYKGFEDKVSIWERKLAQLDEYLQNLNHIQRKWVYLEPIFGRGALPKEQTRFNKVDEDFRSIMMDIRKDSRVTTLTTHAGIRNTLLTILDQLQRCQKSLNEFLEEKRSAFPRFYFIGDDDLLEILGQSTNPSVIQSHLKKLFAGINSVCFDEESKHITAMKSLEGEVVPFKSKVLLSNNVEAWLNDLALEMKQTLKQLLKECVTAGRSSQGAIDPSLFPSQILCLAEQIKFTEDVENAIKDHSLHQIEAQLVAKLERYTSVDTSSEDPGNSESGILELKLKALILDIIHNIDIVKQLNQVQVHTTDDWAWKKQVRFYMKSDHTCYVQMVDSELQYTYEYQGNAPKLVYTPLTDKCYLTLTQAMKMGLGGNPYGPAGTGKTESVKALGGLLGRQVLVFNCDEGIDVKSMGRIFVGLVKCGAWGCFDEFNRLEEAVLSAVSMQIQTIQDALKNHRTVCELLGKEVEINANSGIFITMNPAGKGYGGRQKLPDNLKQLFRPVAMSRPDNDLIAEVILYSEGFKDAKELGRKLVAIFNLSRELLTPQQHYDWGLRALKTVLRGSGNLLRQLKKNSTKQDVNENHIVVQALRLNTMSKFTFADCTRFDALIKDVFPGIDFKEVEYDELSSALKQVFEEANYEVIPNQMKKALELYEQLRQRTGVVIVGPSGAGKSTLWRMLRAALCKIGKVVKQYTMNPKAMPRHQLLGHIDMDTREWSDGVLTNSARQVVREPQDVSSWIICDGDIDPEWIESLNSVLDDNRLLTMPSGERIQFGPNVNFVFETHDLSCASPATISRMGMIFLSDEETDLNSLIKSWLRNQPLEYRSNLENWIGDYFSKALQWVLKQNDYVVETSLVGTVMNGLSHLHGCKYHDQFIINLIRGLGGNLNMKSRLEFTKEVFNWARETPPDSHRPMDTYYDCDRGQLASYMLKKPESLTADDFSNGHILPVIQTPDMQRGLDYFKPWLSSDTKQPFILVGPEGCGKGMLLRYAFSQLRSTEIATIHCSAQTTSRHLLQKLSQTCMVISTNTGRVYRPKDCERLVLYLKDINLPKLDKWGTSTLVAFLQQVLTYQGFYDENLEWVGLENIQIVASMSAGGRLGRHKLTTRFTSIVRLCAIDYPEREQLQTIYGAYLEAVLHKNLKNHSIWGSSSKIYLLAGSMVQVYEQVRAKFTVDEYSHYFFTPCILTQWVLGLFRYDLEGGSSNHPLDYVLEIVAYEARRLFRDKIVGVKELHLFDNILTSVLQGDWGSDILDNMADSFYVTWGAHHVSGGKTAPGQPLPPHGKPLGKLTSADLKDVIKKGLIHYGRDNQNLDILLFQEVLEYMSRIDRVLSFPGGSLLLAGRSGVGRRTVTSLVSHMHGAVLFSPKISRGYEPKQFRNDLKHVLQLAGIEAQQVVLLLEDYQFVHPTFLEMINSLLASGEVPGLYTLEELEPLLLPLKDQASQDGFFGPVFNYFTYRIQQNLHIVLIMDSANLNFIVNCESNPALHKKCQVLWMEGWSDSSMKKIPEMLFSETDGEEKYEKKRKDEKKRNSVDPDFIKSFLLIHESCKAYGATPSRYMTFLHVYSAISSSKKKELLKRQSHLQAGVSKLNEAKALVDELNRKAGEQSILLRIKQDEADSALQEITVSMQDASEQKTELERLKQRIAEEVVKIEERKSKIDDELKEVQPLVNEAKLAVGNIRPESLSEIRSLRMPPDVIRDILEGVLRLMGIFDTSWVSMKSFLAKRGVREDIATFDARNIPKEIRESVEELLFKNKASFDPKNAKRASTAAAPLAAWVKANVQYSHVLERIQPLETEQSGLELNLKKTEDRKRKLEDLLNSVGQKVSELKEKFQSRTSEAAKLEAEVSKAQETIKAAEVLISQLDREHRRWNAQVAEIAEELATLPKRAQLAAAFITYLSAAPEGLRKNCLEEWTKAAGLEKFDLRRFLCTESEQLIWKSEGLPSDDLSIENALVILQIIGLKSWSRVCPFLIDPSSQATEWLKTHLKDSHLEVINQQDSNFITALELAVRFGKTLIIQEMDGVEPVLYPLLRRDLVAQGPRYVVQIGDKIIDYNEDFRLFLSTRNPNPFIPPDAASIVTEVNFTTTRSGLRGQLLALTIQHEKPDLEEQKTKLLQQEEDKKIQLARLEESLLETLATSQGNILENKDLIESLNQTKASSALIQDSLKESYKLQISLDQERDAYLPLAESASKMYFIISDLSKINNMYRFSLASFLRLFQRALQNKQDSENTEERIQCLVNSLKHMVYEYICRCLFKADQLMFALHFVRGMHPELFQENEWDTFTGVVVGDMLRKADSQQRIRDQLPSWIDQERSWAVATLKISLPSLYQTLCLEDGAFWRTYYHHSMCEQEFPSILAKKVSLFQQVLVVQALRPDRLQSAMALFACKALGLKELSPLPLNLKRLYKETLEIEPILIIISPGADPSQELQELASAERSSECYHQVAMGQGQADLAIQMLKECARNGDWLCLKNLHLVVSWLPVLEKELNTLQPKDSFRLWLTAEVHPNFTPILLQSSLKITYESPPGLKKNLMRTYESWTPEQISKRDNIHRAHALFSLAWFHAACQERRNYIPQGWTKFYEFSLSDLRAGYHVIDRLFDGTKDVQWEFVHGLLENSIYGGRVDNYFDLRVLQSYLKQFFNSSIIDVLNQRNKKSIFPYSISLPNSCSILDYRAVIEKLPEDDKPSFFGLPANIARSSQRMISSQVISQLRILGRSVTAGCKFDREIWSNELSPVLNLWKKLNQNSNLIHQKVSPPNDRQGSPILSFIILEQFNAIRLVQSVHQSLAALSKVIRGTTLLSSEVQKLASALLNQKCPLTWQSRWEGPEDPLQYLRGLVARTLAIQNWVEKAEKQVLLADTLDLSELFHPDTFLNALRQETARATGCSVDSLKFVASWKGRLQEAKLQIKISGLLLEGCSFDGNRLSENQHDSPSVSSVLPCYMGWTPQGSYGPYSPDECISLPVYTSAERERVVTNIDVPCGGNQDQWIQCGAALFLKNQ